MGALQGLLVQTLEPQDHDLALLRRTASGDERALHELYAMYGQRMYAFALRLTGDVHTADDVLQESLIAVWQGASRFRGEGRVIAWLLSIVRNKALSALRSHSRRPQESLETDFPSPEPAPQQQADRSEQKHVLQDGLARLSLEHRTVLELVFYQGLSLNETAKVCGCPLGTVKSRLNHAKEHLRGLLQREGIHAEDLL